MLRKEVDKLEMSQYYGLNCDSDEEMNEDESDAEYFPDDDDYARKVIDYDIEKMFEIVKKRDFSHWSMRTIHIHYTKVDEGENGRKQISR